MKNVKFCVTLSILIFTQIVLGSIVYGQTDHFVKIDFDQSNITPGTTINVPIKMSGAQIGNFRHIIKYDHDVLTLLSGSASYTIPSTSQIFGQVFSSPPNPNHASYPGGVYISFTTNAGYPLAYDYNDEVVYYLNFTFNGGNTNFTWWAESNPPPTALGCYLRNAASSPAPVPAYWTGRVGWQFSGAGAAGGDYGVLHSKPAGGDWNTQATWVENKVPSTAYNVFITENEVTVNPSTGSGKCHELTINSGGKLTLNFGKSLNVGGTFMIESNGSFIDQNPTSTLSAMVKRNVTGNYPGSGTANASTIWHYIAAPTSNATIGTFYGCLLNKWTENSSGGIWDTLYLPLTLPLEVGRGYAVAATTTFGDAVFNGPLNTGNKMISGLTNSNPGSGISFFGYHLAGNPFPSAYLWNETAYLSSTNIDGAIYLWNGSTYIAKTPIDGYQIQPEQGFFLHANSTSSPGTLTFLNGNRIHSSGSFLKNSIENQLILTVSGNDLQDETSIRFNTESTIGFDSKYDAYKMYGVYNCPQIFSIFSDINLSINSLPDLNSQAIIPLGFKTGLTGYFTINASGIETFAPGTDLFLTDLFTGKVQNLSVNPTYSFNASPANPEHRFDLQFAPVGINERPGAVELRIYSFENTVNVNVPLDLNGSIYVYDMLGNQVARKQIESMKLNKLDINSDGGYYLVQVVSDKITTASKVFIH